MTAKEHEELRLLKEYSNYLNREGFKRLTFLWNKSDREKESAKKNGM